MVIEDAGELILQTRVNGEIRQDSNTNDLVFDIPALISFLSKGTTLEKGGLIMTGTPSGVGMGRKPPVYLKDRDLVEVYIEHIGTLRNTVAFD
jgi:2-keto-4-pentenoate hydratase/2-oxohepta-3-ene-1,7-dioic acid hydratase in catechol pathway